jgi:hypothetical protein
MTSYCCKHKTHLISTCESIDQPDCTYRKEERENNYKTALEKKTLLILRKTCISMLTFTENSLIKEKRRD